MTKKQKIEKCREILHSISIGFEVVKNENVDFLLNIFEGHTEWEDKKGVGILTISVVETVYKNRCFQLNRIDGSTTDISFNHCITNRTKLSDIKSACRTAIRDEIVTFRKQNVIFGVSKCPISNEILTEENTHIDHFNLSFLDMFNLWLRDKNIDDVYSKIVKTKDRDYVTCFSQQTVIKEFINFHNIHCSLRAVTKISNLSTLK